MSVARPASNRRAAAWGAREFTASRPQGRSRPQTDDPFPELGIQTEGLQVDSDASGKAMLVYFSDPVAN